MITASGLSRGGALGPGLVCQPGAEEDAVAIDTILVNIIVNLLCRHTSWLLLLSASVPPIGAKKQPPYQLPNYSLCSQAVALPGKHIIYISSIPTALSLPQNYSPLFLFCCCSILSTMPLT